MLCSDASNLIRTGWVNDAGNTAGKLFALLNQITLIDLNRQCDEESDEWPDSWDQPLRKILLRIAI
jgi:hypothetical protein